MLSKAIGPKKRNILRLIKEFKFSDVKIYPNKQLAGYEFTCEYERKR